MRTSVSTVHENLKDFIYSLIISSYVSSNYAGETANNGVYHLVDEEDAVGYAWPNAKWLDALRTDAYQNADMYIKYLAQYYYGNTQASAPDFVNTIESTLSIVQSVIQSRKS